MLLAVAGLALSRRLLYGTDHTGYLSPSSVQGFQFLCLEGGGDADGLEHFVCSTLVHPLKLNG